MQLTRTVCRKGTCIILLPQVVFILLILFSTNFIVWRSAEWFSTFVAVHQENIVHPAIYKATVSSSQAAHGTSVWRACGLDADKKAMISWLMKYIVVTFRVISTMSSCVLFFRRPRRCRRVRLAQAHSQIVRNASRHLSRTIAYFSCPPTSVRRSTSRMCIMKLIYRSRGQIASCVGCVSFDVAMLLGHHMMYSCFACASAYIWVR